MTKALRQLVERVESGGMDLLSVTELLVLAKLLGQLLEDLSVTLDLVDRHVQKRLEERLREPKSPT